MAGMRWQLPSVQLHWRQSELVWEMRLLKPQAPLRPTFKICHQPNAVLAAAVTSARLSPSRRAPLHGFQQAARGVPRQREHSPSLHSGTLWTAGTAGQIFLTERGNSGTRYLKEVCSTRSKDTAQHMDNRCKTPSWIKVTFSTWFVISL